MKPSVGILFSSRCDAPFDGGMEMSNEVKGIKALSHSVIEALSH